MNNAIGAIEVFEPGKLYQKRLRFIDMSSWDNEPVPERRWAIYNRVPRGQVGLFSGQGGTGKSIMELHKNCAHSLGRDWLGCMPEPGPTMYVGCEDPKNEIHIRMAEIAGHYEVKFADLIDAGFHIIDMFGEDATLCSFNAKSGRVETTDFYNFLLEAVGDIKPINLSLDTLARVFAGNENDRGQAHAFAGHMQKLATIADGSVTVLSHPSLSGINSGSGLSGSTAWHNAFRFRQYLRAPKKDDTEDIESDLRELEFKKNQYGPLGETITVHYQRGLFLPEGGTSSLDKLAREARVDEMFLQLLKRFNAQDRNVSDKLNSPTYAPTAFAKEAEAKSNRIRKNDFTDALVRLFAAEKIRIENYGRPSRPYQRLEVA